MANGPHTVRFFGYNNGIKVYDSGNIGISQYNPSWITFNWTGIDEIRTSHVGGVDSWPMDDFTYTASVTVSVAVWLLGSGLIGIVGARRKFKK